MEVYFYTRTKCELCEEGKLLLQLLQKDYPFDIIEKDIDASDELTERFGLMIPVVEMNGEIIQYGQIDLVSLEEILKESLK
ncbi:glutaredoxin family protein [Siminovitchia acidinfaciens]|uniref:Glutaredoxin family protein n=1 Tax=Siminovitchia acidinfaciens TaxID=2321395 RepID=A0A429Y8Q5_9BACI|nr:glutaredoxin family protein [Siminovitchia acidinfaciens]RST77758.1 glutaredoxin family protein [Siminovitchia acidinfaciens]VEF47017.1 glutaredoxin 2 [Bacillus freudenreichii]